MSVESDSAEVGFPSKFDVNRLRLCFAFELDNVSTTKWGGGGAGNDRICQQKHYHSNYT